MRWRPGEYGGEEEAAGIAEAAAGATERRGVVNGKRLFVGLGRTGFKGQRGTQDFGGVKHDKHVEQHEKQKKALTLTRLPPAGLKHNNEGYKGQKFTGGSSIGLSSEVASMDNPMANFRDEKATLD